VDERHHWIEEGIATYVEPIARIHAGHLKAERMWFDLVRDMPKASLRLETADLTAHTLGEEPTGQERCFAF